MMIQNDSDILSRIGVASPCSADWDSMTGDERTRFCQQCTKHVYNLSEMSKKEAEQFVLQSEGKTCVRFYLRKDGTIMTEDCPVGLRLIKAGVKTGMRKVSVAVAAVASLLLSIFPGLAANADDSKDKSGGSKTEEAPRLMGEMMALPVESPTQAWMAAYKKTMVAKILEKLPKDWKSDSPQVLVVIDSHGKVLQTFTTKCSADQAIALKLNGTIQSITFAELPKEAKLDTATFRLTIAK